MWNKKKIKDMQCKLVDTKSEEKTMRVLNWKRSWSFQFIWTQKARENFWINIASNTFMWESGRPRFMISKLG